MSEEETNTGHMSALCSFCKRPVQNQGARMYTDISAGHPFIVRTTVQHAGYGCDTGCCGHVAHAYNSRGEEVHSHFELDHPYGEDPEAWARQFVAGIYGRPDSLDWDASSVVDSC